ncbi:tRNA (adenine(58)-N(1))-methyltransferase non-catalytic subunit TRM6 isoform X2 [Microcaecilia unicolor]|uniref:tRNA (adenine(58)-N(1))-methyltransferase non-catalytic subunit TRM6 n=1 Tax=Microcaecilia unicolor TaxID=1415580 RepID=A0A6P7XG48_9AMPH|nr:tRNA (adenine(58)-N(1))-methyltransferase non-catalytic subunit TRM6 isoform X2 [Microcaecilia unicolor]
MCSKLCNCCGESEKIIFEKQWIYLDNAIQQFYGTTFEITAGGNLQPKRKLEETNTETKEAGADNRNIVDDGKSQKLTRDDIEALKEKGIKGQEIVQQLIENSTTFRDKTEFAQEKYIRKKKKKYEAVVTILKPCARILAKMYYGREPGKICQLRYDTLAQMLTLGNIHAGSKVIVMETCAGLVLGAVMERMGGYGVVIQMYPGGGPVRAATDCFGFPKSFSDTLHEFPLSKVNSLLSGKYSPEISSIGPNDKLPLEETSNGCLGGQQVAEKEFSSEMVPESNESEAQEAMQLSTGELENQDNQDQRNAKEKKDNEEKKRRQDEKRKKEMQAAVLLRKKNADGLIIASRFHPAPLLLSLLEFVAPSRPFVIYCQYKEPLLDCYTKLREVGGAVSLRLSETWLRNYQVLPDRSHPKLLMSGGGGYLLSGITVTRENVKLDSRCLDVQKTEEPAPKKQKMEELQS